MAKIKVNIEAPQATWDDLHLLAKFFLAEKWHDRRAIDACELFLRIRDAATKARHERAVDGDHH